jgi:hypothetical protein
MSVRCFGIALSLLLGCSESGPSEAQGGGSGGAGTPAGGGTGVTTAGASGAASGGSSAGSSPGGSPSAGQAGAPGGSGGTGGAPVSGSCDDFGDQAVVRAYTPERFALGDDPSQDPECTAVQNPERGFRRTSNLRATNDFSAMRADGYSTVYGAALLDDYLDQDLDQGLLAAVAASLAAARSAGLKVLPRFYYQADLGAGSNDATLERALTHIQALQPLLVDNEDVIAALHAGFVGAWGEWHGSTTGLHEQEPREQILAALLAVVPQSRMVLVRRPSFKSLAYDGGPLDEASAYDGSELARIGHLNDCFLASPDDSGTYADADEKDYAAADSAFTAVDGETCAVNAPRSDCASAMAELALHHWSTLNVDYQGAVLDGWREQGCFDQIACRLGYRLLLLGHTSPATVSRGSVLSVSLRLVNDGYARPFNARPVLLVLRGPEERALPLDVDPRRFAPGQELELCLGVELPSDLALGDYELGLALPDAASTLADDERYAVRFSNDAGWDNGVNWLGASVTVAP